MVLKGLIEFCLLLTVAKCQGVDLTIQEGTNGSAVVSACLSRLRDSEIFDSDNEILRRIAYVETNDGNSPETYRTDYHGGIWALSEDLFDETKNTASHESSLASLYQDIQAKFSIDWAEVQWYDLRKPLYSALAARLYLSTVSTTFVTLVNNLLEIEGVFSLLHYLEK